MLGEALRLVRVFHDCKITELAVDLGMSRSHISEIENNKKTPSMETLKKYAQRFDMTVSAIMFFAEDLEKDRNAPVKTAVRHKLVRFLQIVENATS